MRGRCLHLFYNIQKAVVCMGRAAWHIKHGFITNDVCPLQSKTLATDKQLAVAIQQYYQLVKFSTGETRQQHTRVLRWLRELQWHRENV